MRAPQKDQKVSYVDEKNVIHKAVIAAVHDEKTLDLSVSLANPENPEEITEVRVATKVAWMEQAEATKADSLGKVSWHWTE